MTTPPPLDDSLAEIAARLDRRGPVVIGLDFDGTLAGFRDHPDLVELDRDTRTILADLARSPRATVLIVSGRSLADVTPRVGVPSLIYSGNHGYEIEGPGISFVEPTALACASRLSELTDVLRARLTNFPGSFVEPKGLTLGVHYRGVPADHWDEVARVVNEVIALEPDLFVLGTGKIVWEIRPRVDWHKGRAILWILDRLALVDPLVFYLGDDRTDEDAFESLDVDAVTVKVGRHSLPTRARSFLEDPRAVHGFLRWLRDRL